MYKEKYLKYKSKYTALKKRNIQIGGTGPNKIKKIGDWGIDSKKLLRYIKNWKATNKAILEKNEYVISFYGSDEDGHYIELSCSTGFYFIEKYDDGSFKCEKDGNTVKIQGNTLDDVIEDILGNVDIFPDGKDKYTEIYYEENGDKKPVVEEGYLSQFWNAIRPGSDIEDLYEQLQTLEHTEKQEEERDLKRAQEAEVHRQTEEFKKGAEARRLRKEEEEEESRRLSATPIGSTELEESIKKQNAINKLKLLAVMIKSNQI